MPRILRPTLLALVLPATAAAQQAAGFDLSVPSIMRGHEIVGRTPSEVRWSADSRWLAFTWAPPGTPTREPSRPYRIRAEAGAQPESLSVAQADSVGPLFAEGDLAPDRKSRVVVYRGDVYLVPLKAGPARRLTRTVAAESDPRFAVDGKRIFFTRADNVFALDLADGAVTQLSDIRPGPAPKEDSAATQPQRKWLAQEERNLIGAVRDRLYGDSVAKLDRKAREALAPKTLYLDKDERISALSVSPSGKAVLVLTATKADSLATIVPNYVTKTGYTEDIPGRSNVGDAQQGGRLGLMHLPSGRVDWIRPVAEDSTVKMTDTELTGWSLDGSAALVWFLTADYKARYLLRVGPDSGQTNPVDVLRDTAWVGGPCVDCAGWLPDGRVWFVSEADGYAHLYASQPDGSDHRQLTSGRWEVLDARLSPDRKSFWLHTSEASPYEQQFYRMPVAGGARERMTARVGGHNVTVSPDGHWLADLFSTANRPPEIFLQPSKPLADAVQLTTSPTAEWLTGPWIVPEIVMIPASDGVPVPAHIYQPKDLGAGPNGAGVIFVHGAGYLHNVTQYWSYYFREYMFHHLLASRGYVVLDLDYRASAGYGRDWRTAIYRHMGGRDLQDQVDASRYLEREYGIAPDHVGIYGGSYGGFITLMALFTEGQHFGAGAALRSVTDWSHYNHEYTAQILNIPPGDSVAYRQSSPIYFAEGLNRPLLIAHGMADTNVEFQDVVRLAQRLIELGKTGWELAVFPVEDHGFVRPSSWTDEYRRIYELFELVLPTKRGTGNGERGPGKEGP
jgi:dipeptidyl aminopeptidase/acylaminoacyl peptidase